MLASKLLSSLSGSEEKLYVDDVFSAYTYTGNGSTQTITNGIDLAGKGGLVWTKKRSTAYEHVLIDSARGDYYLGSNTTSQQFAAGSAVTLSSNGFSLNSSSLANASGSTYVGWTFRKAPKFFDVVTYTGNSTGSTPQTINHSLGVAPGMIIVKATSATSDWNVWHSSVTSNGGWLNATTAFTGQQNIDTVGASSFRVGAVDATTNSNGVTYVAYLFAHDTSTDGIIQCGSFFQNASEINVDLGWEPQYVLVKKADGSADGWRIADTMRGMPESGNVATLYANNSNAEADNSNAVYPHARGFKARFPSTSNTYIYLAIRRPNKPPTSGTQVYNAIARTGTGAAATVTGVGFAPDLVQVHTRSGTRNWIQSDRLRGALIQLSSNLTEGDASTSSGVTGFDEMDGVRIGTSPGLNGVSETYINHFFKRAPGVMDQVCYTGTGSATTVAHNLGVVPELMIVKIRNTTNPWRVYVSPLGATKHLTLNLTDAEAISSFVWNDTEPTESSFTLGTTAAVNGSGSTYVAYLFASLPGISKVGSYTGNGSSQTINCGFSTGCRFFMCKRTDSTGDWYIWDSVRGIIAGNDPHLSLNTTAAEVTTDDSVDNDSSGIIVNQVAATNINVNAATYIYLSFA